MEFLPSGGLSLLVAVAGVGITLKVGNAGIAFALAAVFAFSYMAQLVQQSRQRAQQYSALSWGVLAGLMRSLDIRDQRAARHSAAVARFARDIAIEVGFSAERCELAHTAGLLHDIGRFALSDRVAERGRTLTEEDWVAIQRHPELGADMLRDLGIYGPVAEIVLAHHERIDGRGYPNGLGGEEIPEIAKIISVAEVYDTLTASDTYRTQMSSFEALRELRRVAGIAAGRALRRGAGGAVDRRGRRVPARRHGRFRHRAQHGAPDPRGVGRGVTAGGGVATSPAITIVAGRRRWRISRLALQRRIGSLLLQRTQEGVDLLLAEATLSPRGPVGLQITHVRPAPDRPEGDSECLGCLRRRQPQRTSVHFPHEYVCGAIGKRCNQVQQLHNFPQEIPPTSGDEPNRGICPETWTQTRIGSATRTLRRHRQQGA